MVERVGLATGATHPRNATFPVFGPAPRNCRLVHFGTAGKHKCQADGRDREKEGK